MMKFIALGAALIFSTPLFATVYHCQAFEVDAQGNNNGIGNFSVDTRAEKLQWVSAGQDVVAACSGADQQNSSEFVIGCGFLQEVDDFDKLSEMNPANPSLEDNYEWNSISITLETAGALYQRTKIDGRLLGLICSTR